ncbi:hypothetical protein LX15_004268 [Streptoalloteichus tenebrarius]|uniref:Uncharacterized protein n=1 Tax=Streptoalloteichus tenebrarius (strain ATCC 17920 / DSM 40477 / JCM 4838 / CBS 697.72 / NBRC 16177 / NCIMB 11028 / NRRL B-12390 / A12253. 1 / ISP 5477) TaxID=1933 RepID=A0ABT1HYJ7_STRSD|nr:hypothetical protein [Streptoalloteichus tenebrarius]BFF01890.1 hypothetical protein GCM10020241_35650 [Streptoalloteichus tenebrarius]
MAAVERPELTVRPEWGQTGDVFFPVAALVEGEWWVLRINNFPNHPLWTLFVGGRPRFDLDDAPATWANPAGRDHKKMPADLAAEALRPVQEFVAYGSEYGVPCRNPRCCG